MSLSKKKVVHDDRLYFNVVMANDGSIDNFTTADYRRNFDESIVDNPSDYYLSVVRFSIPTANIPIMIPEIKKFPNTNVNLTDYVITLTYQGFTSGPVNIIYQTTTPNAQPRPITALNPNPMIDPSRYYWIFTYSHFVRLVNATFQTAFDLLNTASGGALVGTKAPVLFFDPNTLLLSYQFAPIYLYTNAPNARINVFMNYKLLSFLDGFDFLFLDSKSDIGAQVTPYATGNNFNGTDYTMTQNYQTLALWNVFKSIQLVTNLIPIKNEYVPIPNNENRNTLNSRGIIKDFIPLYDKGPEGRTFINFTLGSAYQLINLNSNTPLKSVDISIFWEDRYGNSYPVTIPYNQIATLKFVFIKKDTFTG